MDRPWLSECQWVKALALQCTSLIEEIKRSSSYVLIKTDKIVIIQQDIQPKDGHLKIYAAVAVQKLCNNWLRTLPQGL